MATETTNYKFKKPAGNEYYSVEVQNDNWDAADAALKELDTPTFEDYTGDAEVPAAATALENIKSKGPLKTLLSNIKAFCKGCVTLAMLVNDTATNNSKLPVSAAVAYDLQQQINVQNTNLKNKLLFDRIVSFFVNNNESRIYKFDNQGIFLVVFDGSVYHGVCSGMAMVSIGIASNKLQVFIHPDFFSIELDGIGLTISNTDGYHSTAVTIYKIETV